jgi:hypothetical protein
MPSKFNERREEVYLCNTIFSDGWQNELREIDKHEILVKMSDVLGPCPSNFNKAEEIFDSLKFEITKYVLHHEYCKKNGIRSNLLLWLDRKINPANAKKLSTFFNQILKD